ncbi:hypothetical protein E2493_06080 [Sphingomonas parva]|uniref:Portal protein n=1 Tax=Sphingomonas parva TaxID=2555898 RepID=A0A4Y8ZUV4_9SPHN|nr:hypothetical protein [Sphingomonas parva]TFI59092.1 hypothetical protein E2493_06080 [Sphingomonas parva]
MIEVDPELIAFLREEADRCRDDTLQDERETAIDRYNGRPYGDEEEGRSQVVARDTAETCDYMTISILRTIVSGDRVVEFVHRDTDAARRATETLMHLLMDAQDGYRLLHDWLKAGLLEKNAVAMTWGEPQPPRRIERIVPEPLLGEIAPIEAEETGTSDALGHPLWRVVMLAPQPPRFRDAAVPNEEFYCSPDARTIDEAVLKGRRVRRSVGDLVAAGFDAEALEAVCDDAFDTPLGAARDEDRWNGADARTGPSRTIWWHEDYVKFDADGDGVAETLYVQRSADFKVFAIEALEDPDDHPFEDWCPVPMPHRRIGQSLADKVMDIERIRTVLLRQSLDGIYLANNPSTYVHEDSIGENTIEDLLSVRPGRLVRWRGAVPPVERSGHFDPGAGFTMIEMMNGERESRTGITRLNQGLDAEALNRTATGTALMQAQGQQMEEYLARNFANALARLFTRKARLLKRYGRPIAVPIDGRYVEVNPAEWPDDMVARARVGLGSGRKEQRLAYRRELIGYQSEALRAGLDIVDAKGFYESARGLIGDMGLGDAGAFFRDPAQPQIDPSTGQPVQKPPKPDPALVRLEAEMALRRQELQLRAEEAQAALALKRAEAAERASIARDEAAARHRLDAEAAAARREAEQARARFEAELAEIKTAQEYSLEQRKLELAAHAGGPSEGPPDLADNRPGGDLSE